MKKIHWLIVGISLIILVSCQSKQGSMEPVYKTELVETKKITLPVDENTYYLSKSIFHFEDKGKEYLSFGNQTKRQYATEIIIYDLNEQDIHKRFPLLREGSNAIPAAYGAVPWDQDTFIYFQNNIYRITLSDRKGQVTHRYTISPSDGKPVYMPEGLSYAHYPSFMIDSTLYFAQGAGKQSVKRHEWKTIPMFALMNLRNGEISRSSLCFPSIFDMDVKDISTGHEFVYDYNYKDNRLVCSFIVFDSLMVTDDMKTVRWHDGKSRYLDRMRPILKEDADGYIGIKEAVEAASYSHIMYDKYRDIYYRFAEMPCELGPNEYVYNDAKAREFSVIIFDKDFRIIGETKFPGNKYFYKMSFVGRDGLYISENNEANPEFDENKLVFACFGLQDLKN